MASQRIEEWKQHWPVAFGAAIVAATGGSVWVYVMSEFIEPLQNAFGWSKGDIAGTQVFSLLGAAVAPFIGRLADRYGVRPVLLVGNIVVGLCFIALALNPGSLPYFYLFSAAMAVGATATSSLTFTRAVSSWFETSRGLALSSTRIGLTAVAAILPAILLTSMSHFGLQAGYLLMAALTFFVCLPIGWLFVKDRRDDTTARSTKAGTGGFAARLALFKNWRVILLAISIGTGTGAMVGILSQLQPLLVWYGIPGNQAAGLIGIMAISTLVSTLAVGYLLDRIWGPLVGFIATLAPVVGCYLLISSHENVQIATIAIILVGLAAGAEIDIVGYLTARYFGMKSYGLIYGTIVMVSTVFLAFCGYMGGHLYDVYNGYEQALILFASLYAISAVSYLLLGPYPKLAAAPANPVGAPVPAE